MDSAWFTGKRLQKRGITRRRRRRKFILAWKGLLCMYFDMIWVKSGET
jgi:hypothetical protein